MSPALEQAAPAARAADAFPHTFHAIVALVPGADALVRDAYLKNCDVAFGAVPFEDVHFERAWAAAAHNARVLDAHPQARATIASVSAHALRADRLPGYRDALRARSRRRRRRAAVGGHARCGRASRARATPPRRA